MSWSSQVASWQAFYATAGGGATALVGLLFVALSMQVEVMVSRSDVRALAGRILNSFLSAIAVALVMLMPSPGPAVTGEIVLVLAVFNLLATARSLWTGLGAGDRLLQVAHLLRRFAAGVIANVGLVGIGVALHAGVSVFYSLALYMIVVLATGVYNTWDLILRVAAEGRAKRPAA